MREGERLAESEDHLRSSAAKPAVLPIRNSRRPGICVPSGAVQDFRRRSAKQGRKQRKNAYRAGGKPVQLRIVYLRLFIRRSRTSAYGSCGLQVSVPLTEVSRLAASPSGWRRTFARLSTPVHRAPVSMSDPLAMRRLLILNALRVYLRWCV